MNNQIKEWLEKAVAERNFKFGNPMSQEEIASMEKKLQVKIPKEYREFLENYGCIRPEEILGSVIPNLKQYKLETGEYLWTAEGWTLDLRRAKDIDGDPSWDFPKNCIVINVDGGGGYFCVVCGGKDDGRVILWDSYCDPKQAYPNNPTEEWFKEKENIDWDLVHVTKKKEDFWVQELDFWRFLFRIFESEKNLEKFEKGELDEPPWVK